jgi:hypothetical protein
MLYELATHSLALEPMQQLYRRQQQHLTFYRCTLCACTALPPLQYNLPEQLTPAELQDMLIIAVNLPHPWAAAAILRYDEEHKLLLHAKSNTAAAPDSIASSSSIDSSAVKLVEQLITTAVIRAHYMLSAELSVTPAAQQLDVTALTQLLYVCIQLERVIQPAGHANAIADDDFFFDQPHQEAEPDIEAPCFSVLCSVPAVQDISACSLANLMRLAVKQQQFEMAERLAALPAAQQLLSRQLCEVLLLLLVPQTKLVRWAQQKRLLMKLSELESAQNLGSDALLWLLAGVVTQQPHEPPHYLSSQRPPQLRILADMKIGNQLTSTQVLQLLQLAAEQGSSTAISYLSSLEPAQRIDDVEGFAAFLQAAAVQHIPEFDLIKDVASLPVVQQLGADAVYSLIQACLNNTASARNGCEPCRVWRFLVDHPAVSSFSTAVIEQLLLTAAHRQCLSDMASLLDAPAAAGLSVEATAESLQCAAQRLAPLRYVRESDTISVNGGQRAYPSELEVMRPSLLDLPAAQQLSADAVMHILKPLLYAPKLSGAMALVCTLPGAQQISREAALEMLKQTVQHSNSTLWLTLRDGLPQLAALPAEQLQLTSKQLVQILPGALEAGDGGALSVLCGLVAEAESAAGAAFSVSPEHLLTLLLVAYRQHSEPATAAAAQLLSLQAATALGPDAVAELMQACVKCHNAAGVALVGQLPAALQLSEQTVEQLLLQCLAPPQQQAVCGYCCTAAGDSAEGYHSSEVQGRTASAPADDAACHAVLLALLRQPAVQTLTAAAQLRVLSTCLEERLEGAFLLLCSHLPLTGQHAALDNEGNLRLLLQLAFESQLWGAFDWLAKQAGGLVDDGEVAMWCTVRACQAAL